MEAIEEYFKFTLGRPEIYNRMGNNFVVFDYIRPAIIGEILDKQLVGLAEEVLELKNIELVIRDQVRSSLLERASANLDMGGRGVRNQVETSLLNTLARVIYDEQITDCTLVIEGIEEVSEGGSTWYRLKWSKTEGDPVEPIPDKQ